MKNFLFFSLAVMTSALAAVIIVCLISIPSYLEKKSEPMPPPPPPTPQIKTIEAHLITDRTTVQQTLHMLGNPYSYYDGYGTSAPTLTYYLYPIGPCYIISITLENGMTTTKKYAYNKDNYAKSINCGSVTDDSSFKLVFYGNQTFSKID